MKIKIIKSISFMLILMIILIILSRIFEPKNNSVAAGMHSRSANGILAEPDNTIDVIVVGNSEAYTSVIPMEIWDKYGYTSYVCASPDQPLALSVRIVSEVLKHQKPKAIMLEASNIHITQEWSEASDQTLNYFLKVFQYHDRWKSLKREDFTQSPEYNTVNFMKGYEYSKKVRGYKVPQHTKREKPEPAKIPRINQLYISAINQICKKNDIKLIVVSTPSNLLWSEETHTAIKDMCDKSGIDYLDLNIHKDDARIDWENETRDEGAHLNHKGALKTTNMIGKYLNEKDILESHKNDENYKHWNDQYIEYKKIIESEV